MNTRPPESYSVPVDVLPPLPADPPQHSSPVPSHIPLGGMQTFYHPASGVVILGIDMFVFGTEILSGFLDLPVMCVLAFLATFPLVFLIQRNWGQDRGATALGKAFLGAFLAGLPFSIAGGIFGAAVIALSGLPRNPFDAYKKLTAPRSTP